MSEETFRIVVSIGVGLAAIFSMAGGIAIIVIAAGLAKLQARVQTLIDRAEPILDTTRRIMDDTAPKIARITTDVADVVKIGKEQSDRVGELIKDFSARAKIQVARIDGTIDHTIDDVQSASTAVKGAVMKPVREVNGLLTGLKTAVSVYALGRRASVDNATQDEEMFI